MIRLTASADSLIQRLKQRAGELANRKLASLRRSGGRGGRAAHPWRSPGTLWPDFTDAGGRN
jgi:hypothetical protein